MINNVRISRCLFYVSKVLDDVIKNNNKKRTSGSIPFYMIMILSKDIELQMKNYLSAKLLVELMNLRQMII